MSSLARGTAAVGALGLGALAWSALVEVRWYTLRRVTVPVLAPGSAPLRVLHVSDIHLVPRQTRKAAWLRALADLEPDLVVNTGDNLADAAAVPAVLEALEPLLAYPGAFVLGSNDYFAPRPKNPALYLRHDAREPNARPSALPTADLVAGFTAAGWRDLTNRRDRLQVADQHLALVGVDDPHLDRDIFPAPDDDAAALGAATLRVGVTHAPYLRVLDAMRADGCDLVLAGHTHGGQLCVPGYGALVTNCDLDTGRVKGLHGWPGARPDAPGGRDSTWLHVSAGLGTSPYAPVRFACRPEATLLTLVAR